jgi:hypothetical protein
MKILTLLTFFSISSVTCFSQVNQGSFVIDPYYGFPNFGKNFASAFENSSTSSLEVKGIGPIGLRSEYVLSDKFGVGFDVIYNSYDIRYTNVDSLYDGVTGTYTTVSSNNRNTMQRLRVQARFNYHFETSNPQLDTYFGLGAGTNNRFRKAYENGIEIDDETELSNFTLLPFSLRVCAGLRYYFTDNIGVNMELGLGGPFISGGISMRFY